jgi:adenine-specific DNA-methyltransferase
MNAAIRQPENEETLIMSQDKKRQELGQFFTPRPMADFLASFFEARWRNLNLLDAGAGNGALSASLVKRLCASSPKPEKISITAYEFDEALIGSLQATMHRCREEAERAGIQFSASILNEDFIASTVPMVRNDFFTSHLPHYNGAIVNPPYRKIRSDSPIRLLLRSVGIETSNLYTGFIALITKLLGGGGELVAITPRSFCNGPYFKPFRTEFLETMALRRLHVFESRSKAFSQDDVLQENIIIHAIKGAATPKKVTISSSSGAPGHAVTEYLAAYQDVVPPNDSERFIHLVQGDMQDQARTMVRGLPASLGDLGMSVSTGRVVGFRAKEFLRQQPEHNTAPLIYPCHFNGGFVHWPKPKGRKPNAIVSSEQTRELLVPAGIYVLVKRFTAKEERKRIVACIYDSHQIHAPFVGFENHLNYFHINGHGLSMHLAKGLAAYLNSTIVDKYFRQFNGHTQVNATDLRCLHYPQRARLEKLAQKITDLEMKQDELDALVKQELFS